VRSSSIAVFGPLAPSDVVLPTVERVSGIEREDRRRSALGLAPMFE
jgi:hypothetical protein